MNSRNTIIAVVVLLIILFGGFQLFKSSQNTSPAPSTEPQAEVSPSPSTEANSATESTGSAMEKEEYTIKITAAGFTPKTVTIKAGETVTWVNEDTKNHQVNSSPHPAHTDYPPLNTVGLLAPGEKRSLTFPDKGVYKFHDHLNPTLFGSVTVE